MMLGVVASTIIGGRFIGKISYRNIMLVSITLMIISIILLGTISIDSKRGVVTLYMILMGLGMGVAFPITATSALQNLDFRFRGSATSMNTFFRTIGSAIGITVFGTLQTQHLKNSLQTLVPPEFSAKIGDGRGLLQEAVQKAIPPETFHKLLSALADSIAFVYQWSIVVGVLAVVFILMMGGAKMEVPAQTKQKA
jgi:MFS family permease